VDRRAAVGRGTQPHHLGEDFDLPIVLIRRFVMESYANRHRQTLSVVLEERSSLRGAGLSSVLLGQRAN
jgi:hypothetical protein